MIAQLEIDFDRRAVAEKGRDRGMQVAGENAERKRPGWSDDAAAYIARWPADQFTTEQLREFAYAKGLDRPPTNWAWGGVLAKASRAGWILPAGFVQCEGSETMHKRPVRLWRKAQ